MKLASCALLLLLSVTARLAAGEIAWRADSPAALQEAAESGKPLLLDFTAPWCGPCRLMESTTFADATVQAVLDHYIPVRIDFDKNPALVGKYRITGIPALIILNRFGEMVVQSTGYLEPAKMIDWLSKAGAGAFSKVSKAEVARLRERELVADLDSADPAIKQRGMNRVIESFLSKDELASVSEKVLKGLVEKKTSEMIPWLNDSHLAIRILLANEFARKMGPGFSFDPWETPEARAAALAEWRVERSPTRPPSAGR